MDHDQQQAFEQMSQTTSGAANGRHAPAAASSNGAQPAPVAGQTPGGASEPRPQQRSQRFLLVRHGQSTFNVEGRLPSQLPGVALTEEGRRQAQQAAIGLAGLRLSAVVTSPLERARDTAEMIARGWGLTLREEPRLMDTEMGRLAGRKISEIADDPGWKAFLQNPTNPPDGFEGFNQVRDRAVAAIEDLRTDETVGDEVVVVAHADVIKIILAHYTGVPLDGSRFIVIGNASVSVLAFTEGHPATLLATNWSIAPGWLVSPAQPTAQQPTAAGNEPQERDARAASNGQTEGGTRAIDPNTGEPSGVIM